jgi:3-oxoacyl-[acyl-carrier protein] reductase
MDLALRRKNVIVTGASRGIGRAIALGFADEGANVAICARGQAALDATRDDIMKRGVKAFAQSSDVGDAAQLNSFIDTANDALGGIDVLINNPSGFGGGDDEASWVANFQVDLMASVRATQRVVPLMQARGGGTIVHIASISGLEGSTRAQAYAAIKAAMISHSKSMALSLAQHNIRVNCVSPGSIEFPGGVWDQRKNAGDPLYESTRRGIAFGRMGLPEEVAAVVVFAASSAASWLTGAHIPVDGGQHRGNL